MASTPRRPSALEHGSDHHETLPKRVSDDPRQVNFRRKTFFSSRFFGLGNRFAPFWTNFGGSTEKRTSTANSSQFFALDAPIMSSVRPKIVGNMSVGALGSEMYRSNPPCPQPHQCGQGKHWKESEQATLSIASNTFANECLANCITALRRRLRN